MSAFQAVKVREHAKHVLLPEGRSGAGDEGAGSDIAGVGQEDHLVAGEGDSGRGRAADAPLARAVSEDRLRRTAGSTTRPAQSQAVPIKTVEKVLALYPERY